jgi:hypothetical protein
MSVTYTATLTAREQTVLRVSSLLHAKRRQRGTRAGTRVLSCFDHAVMVIRWLLDGTRVTQLAADYQIGRSTCYDNLHEALDVLAAQAPGLHSALLAAKAAGYDSVIVDGTLIETDRCRTPGPTAGVDLWWSGKHEQHGGNIQVITAPDGWPLWTSPVRPGREHDTTALREHHATPDTIWRHFLDDTGTMRITPEDVTVELALRSHHPILIDAGYADLQTPIPWWNNRPLRFRFPPR